ncbi:MAG: hypothetical protein AAGF67_12080, partial [Verrucomicrobiota bacterium]
MLPPVMSMQGLRNLSSAIGLAFSGLLLVPCAFAQESGSSAAPIQATPVPQAEPVFAPQGATPMSTSDLVPAANSTISTAPTPAKTPVGTRVSSMQARSRVIEDYRPERVQVYPEDPESAWWEINPHYAFARAQREQKPLLLLFTGIWNTQAMALSQEVFATKSFNEYVKENLVICYLHYERNFT